MKKSILMFLTLAAFSSSSQAFVVATSNLINADATGGSPVTTFSGSVIGVGSGSISVGYFSTLADANLKTTLFSTLKNDFQQLGSSLAFANGFSAPGFFDVGLGAAIADGSAFIGKSVYVFLGNANTIADSTDIAVWKGGITFQADSVSVGGNVVLDQAGFSSLLVGTDGGTENVLGIDFNKSIRMANAPIPEPSTALLGALGALGLLRRRRI
jgi:hypothetical protein